MNTQEQEVLLSELETRVDRLRVLYDQYFLGFEKLEPTVPRKDVDRRFAVLRKEQIRNTALRFRLNVLTQKYNTYSMYWMRVCRQIEEGTYKRHVQRARQRFQSVPPPSREAEAQDARPAHEAKSDDAQDVAAVAEKAPKQVAKGVFDFSDVDLDASFDVLLGAPVPAQAASSNKGAPANAKPAPSPPPAAPARPVIRPAIQPRAGGPLHPRPPAPSSPDASSKRVAPAPAPSAIGSRPGPSGPRIAPKIAHVAPKSAPNVAPKPTDTAAASPRAPQSAAVPKLVIPEIPKAAPTTPGLGPSAPKAAPAVPSAASAPKIAPSAPSAPKIAPSAPRSGTAPSSANAPKLPPSAPAGAPSAPGSAAGRSSSPYHSPTADGGRPRPMIRPHQPERSRPAPDATNERGPSHPGPNKGAPGPKNS